MRKHPTIFNLVFPILFFIACWNIQAQKSIDLSEKVLKVQERIIHTFGDQGFAFYDWGEKKMKFFNWDFEITIEIPLPIGEGPAEIKPFVLCCCLAKDKIFLNGFNEKKIKVFDRKGNLVEILSMDFPPRNIFYHKNLLYVINLNYTANKESPLLAKIVDPVSGNAINEIRLERNFFSSHDLGGDTRLSGLGTLFDIQDNMIYQLFNMEKNLLKFDEKGKFIEKISLPYKTKMTSHEEKDGNEVILSISQTHFYRDMKVIKNNIYACFYSQGKKDKTTGKPIIKTYVLKVSQGGKYSDKILDGKFQFLGEHQGILYLFNFEDYMVTSINLDQWK